MVAPLEPVQLRLIEAESTPLAVRTVGGAGAGDAPPRKTPHRTALGPPLRVTVIVTVPRAPTLIGALTQAPKEKSVLRLAVRGPEPSLTVMVWRRPLASQSMA